MSRTISHPKGRSSPDKHSTSSKYKLFIWDVGTAGGQPSETNIRTLAAIEFSSRASKLNHFSTAVRPESVTTPRNPTPTFREAWTTFRSFITDYSDGKQPLLVSHNAAFDVTVLLTELRRANIKIPSTWRFACSLLLSRSVYPFNADKSQIALADRLGISINRQHHTSEDVIVLRQILLALDDKALQDDKPVNRVVPSLSLHAFRAAYFDRTPQISSKLGDTTAPKFFITNTGTKYHRQGCKWLRGSKIPRDTPPPGMKPCRVCRPDDENFIIPDRTSKREERSIAGSSKKLSHSGVTQFFITTGGAKYHMEGCKWLSKSKIPVDYPPEGLKPCGSCLKNFSSSLPVQDASKSRAVALQGKKEKPAKGVPYYITKTGKCYHVKGCSSLTQSRIPKSEPPSGYGPCGKCLPNFKYNGSPEVKRISK